MFPIPIDIQQIIFPMKEWWGSSSENHATGWDGIWIGGQLVFSFLLSWNQNKGRKRNLLNQRYTRLMDLV